MASLQADYAQPTEGSEKTFKHDLPQITAHSSTEERVVYLSALRTSAVHLQDEINNFLTLKMEQDKAAAEGTGKSGTDDAKDEENYGEEVVEDDG